MIIFEPPLACFSKIFFRKTRPDFSNDIVLVTGGAQGIGKEIAILFAEHGCTIVLWDIKEAKLKETSEELKSQGYKAHYYVVDVSKKEKVYETASQVQSEIGDITILVNNAGITQCKKILDSTDDEIQLINDVNYLAHYWLLKAFLPSMLEKNYGYVVGIASAASFIGSPFISSYCASKAAVLSLYESLTGEVYIAKKDGVSVTCVCPGFIQTESFNVRNLFLDESIKGMPVLMPQDAAKRILHGIAQKRGTVVFPMYVPLLVGIKHIFSEKVSRLILHFSWTKGMKALEKDDK